MEYGGLLKLRSWVNVIWGCAILAVPAYVITSSKQPQPSAPPIQAQGPRAPASSAHNACTQMYRTICQKRGETRDPTGVVRPDVDGELQALRTYETIIHEHPDWSSERVD